MLRGSARFHGDERLKLTDRALVVAQSSKQPDPDRMTEATEEIGLEATDGIEPRRAALVPDSTVVD